jgi:nicotinic acid mononucleotide adenylyltransferase
MKRRVLLFGLSGNPPTGEKGHVGIVRYLRSLAGYDEVRVIPVYRHMFSSKRNRIAPFEQRFEMCKLAFLEQADDAGTNVPVTATAAAAAPIVPSIPVLVSDVERVVTEEALAECSLRGEDCDKVRVGTAEILDYLVAKEGASTEFTFVLGSDTYADLCRGKWRRCWDIMEHLAPDNMLVIVRKGIDTDVTELAAKQKQIATANSNEKEKDKKAFCMPAVVHNVQSLSDVSSSKILEDLNGEYAKENLSPKVLEYITHHDVYGSSSLSVDSKTN